MQHEDIVLTFHNYDCIHKWQNETQHNDNCEKKIEEVNTYKYLGVHVDHNFKWKTHIDYLHKKLRTSSYTLFHLSNCAPYSVLKQSYFSLSETYLRHGITAWGTSSYCNELQKTQYRIVRILIKSHNHLPQKDTRIHNIEHHNQQNQNLVHSYNTENFNSQTQPRLQFIECESTNLTILNNVTTGDVHNNNTQNCLNNSILNANSSQNFQPHNNNNHISTINCQLSNSQTNTNSLITNSTNNNSEINNQIIYNAELNTAQHNSQRTETQQNPHIIVETKNDITYRNRYRNISTEVVKNFMKQQQILNTNSLYKVTIINDFHPETAFLQKINHAYDTRRRSEGRYKVPTFNNQYGKNTIAVQLPTTLNTLPYNLLELRNNKTFKKHLKNIIIKSQ